MATYGRLWPWATGESLSLEELEPHLCFSRGYHHYSCLCRRRWIFHPSPHAQFHFPCFRQMWASLHTINIYNVKPGADRSVKCHILAQGKKIAAHGADSGTLCLQCFLRQHWRFLLWTVVISSSSGCPLFFPWRKPRIILSLLRFLTCSNSSFSIYMYYMHTFVILRCQAIVIKCWKTHGLFSHRAL